MGRRNELTLQFRIIDPLTDLLLHEVRDKVIGSFIIQRVRKAANPLSKAGGVIHLLEYGLLLFRGRFSCIAWIVVMNELRFLGLHHLIPARQFRTDLIHQFLVDLRIAKRQGVIRTDLENIEVAHKLRKLGDALNTSRAGSNNRYALALQAHVRAAITVRIRFPLRRVPLTPLEVFATFYVGDIFSGEHAHREDQIMAPRLVTIMGFNGPIARFIIEDS